jgi:uncharacterized protein YodC (DUF2158 family)
MSNDAIKAGDVVQLKSGGPKMTVEKIYQTPSRKTMVHCKWFDKDNNIKAESFEPGSLQQAP